MPARCDRCGRFVDADALVISAFIPYPHEGMEDTVYCPRCAPDPAPAGGDAAPTSRGQAIEDPAGATLPTTDGASE